MAQEQTSAGKRMSELEDTSMEIIHLENRKKKRMKKEMNRASVTCGTPSNKTTYTQWVSQKERRERKEQKEYWKKYWPKFSTNDEKHQSTHPRNSTNSN